MKFLEGCHCPVRERPPVDERVGVPPSVNTSLHGGSNVRWTENVLFLELSVFPALDVSVSVQACKGDAP